MYSLYIMDAFKRALLFIFACIPIRLFLAYLPQILPTYLLQPFGIVIMTMAIGFAYLGITGKRMQAGEGGGKTWWADIRLVHAGLLGTASLYLLMKNRTASVPLMLDSISGILFFFNMRLGVF